METALVNEKLWHYPKKNVRVKLSFYGKKGTIGVSKDVIRLLGAPPYISLRVNKSMDSIMIVPGDNKSFLSFKVPEGIYEDARKTMRFTSISFVRGIFELNNLLMPYTYQMEGTYIEERNVVVFDISDARICDYVKGRDTAH